MSFAFIASILLCILLFVFDYNAKIQTNYITYKYFVLKKIKEEIKTGRGNKTTAPKKQISQKELCILLYFIQKQISCNVSPGVELMTRDEQTLRIVFVRLRKTGNVFHFFNAREYIARHIIFTY